MATVDPAASLARLGAAAARLCAASSPEDVLEALADEARMLARVDHAWAARLDGGQVTSVHVASTGTPPQRDEALPPFSVLLTAARPIARHDGFVGAALASSSGAAEGVLALPRSGTTTQAEDAALDLVLAPLAVIAGLALEAARLRARVDAITRARETLFASISHDLRNPLNTFSMSAGLLRDDLERNDVNVARSIGLVARMERATSRMQGLIEDLMDASRIDARKIDLAIREEPASQLLEDAVAVAARAASDKGASVTCDKLDPDARVMADRARTVQLIGKVIAFEAKSTGDGGTVHLALTRRSDAVLFTARAVGPGGLAVTPPEEGRGGLALHIARGLVEAQRGTFAIEPGNALVVTFTLPSR